MRTLRPSSIGYAESVDHLYVAFDGSDPTCVSREEEAGPWVTLQYSWPDGRLVSMEVYGLVEHFGEPPLTIVVDSEEPFAVEIPAISRTVVA